MVNSLGSSRLFYYNGRPSDPCACRFAGSPPPPPAAPATVAGRRIFLLPLLARFGPQLTAPLAAGGGVRVPDFRANRGGLSTALLISLPCMATAARWRPARPD